MRRYAIITLLLLAAFTVEARMSCLMLMHGRRGVMDFPLDGLVAYWAMEDDAATTAVTDSHGIHNGVATTNTSAMSTNGIIDKALYFNGATEALMGEAGAFAQAKITVSVWMRMPAAGQGNWHGIIMQGGASENGWDMRRSGLSPGGAVAFRTKGNKQIYSDNVLFDGTWHHVVAVYDQVNLIMYVDGVLQVDTLEHDDVASASTTTKVAIGGRGGNTRHTIGTIDEVGIWNRALTPAEVAVLYNDGAGRTYP